MSNLMWISIFFCCTCTYSRASVLDRFKSSKVDINELFFEIYTRADPIGARVNLTDGSNIASLSSFNINLRTFVYIHGWLDTINKPLTSLLKDSLLNASDVNVLLLSWDTYASSINYFASKGCVEDTGNYLGEFLKAIQEAYSYTLDNVTLVGHSLGAHIAGYAGKKNNGTLGVIVGLDPAGPFFFEDEKNHRLNENDAQYVQAIHTCATGIVGVTYRVGNADFWPNGGLLQPGCGEVKCPHLRSVEYYAESFSTDGFVGCNCDSYQDYKHGKCSDEARSVMGGLNVDRGAQGNYYLDTNGEAPYAKGDSIEIL